jgi:hypothetical protein
MAGSGRPVEFSVDQAKEGTPMVAMAALDAERRPPSNRARARELQRSEKRLVERSKGSNFQILLCLAASRASRGARSLAVFPGRLLGCLVFGQSLAAVSAPHARR